MSNLVKGALAACIVSAGLILGGCSGSDSNGNWQTISANNNNKRGNNPSASPNGMNNSTEIKSGGFTANLPDGFTQPTDDAGRRLMKEYGAVFVARGGAVPPKTVFFKDEAEVSAFQTAAGSTTETIGGVSIKLQPAAMKALKEAVAEGEKSNLKITPRGTDAAARTYNDTVGLWASRVDPGLAHWIGKGRITAAQAQKIKAMSPFEQIPEILKLEEQGIFFAKDLSKSIIYSVAPPGSSQHLSMLALDVTEHENAQVRELLARHGWYQTVVSDLPHFTFLGANEKELTQLGLKKSGDGGRAFWVPNV